MSRFNVDISSGTSYPTCPMSSLDLQDSQNLPLNPSQQQIHMQIVGSMLFLSTRSRLTDLSFHINYLSHFMTKAQQQYLDMSYNSFGIF